MNLKKDLKKLEKLSKAKAKKLSRNLHKYLKKQKLTQGDRVFVFTFLAIFLVTLAMVARFAFEITKSPEVRMASSSYGLNLDRRPESDIKAISLGFDEKEGASIVQNAGSEGAVKDIRLPILMYHHVDDLPVPYDRTEASLQVTTFNFESQLRYLKDQGFKTLSLDDVYRTFHNEEALPPKSVVITFDDGYQDNYVYAYPLLKKYGFTATFFIISGTTEGNESYLSKAELKEMAEAGMEIESHTVDHPDLTRLTSDQVLKEMIDSKVALKDIIGRDVFYISYPFGANSQQVIEQAQKAGYLLGLTIHSSSIQKTKEPFRLSRITIGPQTTVWALAAKLAQ